MTTLNLHVEALADLRRSGLSDTTIVEAGLYTPAPGELPRLLAPRLVNRVTHILVIPYRGAEPFYRAKLFPPVPDGQGHSIRYYQPAGTAPRLYLPGQVATVLADPQTALYLSEGEKKALRPARRAWRAWGSVVSGTGGTRGGRLGTWIGSTGTGGRRPSCRTRTCGRGATSSSRCTRWARSWRRAGRLSPCSSCLWAARGIR